MIFEELRFLNVFRPHLQMQSRRFKSPELFSRQISVESQIVFKFASLTSCGRG